MIKILKNKKLYKHLAIMIFLAISILLISIYSLKSFTRHGEEITIPNLTGFYYEELIEQAEYSKFRFKVIDSIYDATKEKGTIISQDPKPESLVKENRHIYLTVVAMNPEMVKMPNLIDLSLRNAKSIIETYGLKINKLSYVPNIAKNAVVEQKYREETIYPGTEIVKGGGIELVLGLGMQKELIQVPLLIGLTRSEALNELYLASLNIGKEHFEEGDDTTTVRIYRQAPNYSEKSTVKMGQSIELWYKSDENFDFEQYLKTIKPSNEFPNDSLINDEDEEQIDF